MSFISHGIAWFVLANCLAALLLIIFVTGIYCFYHMSIDKVRVHRIDWKIKEAYTDEDTKAQLSRYYVCCGKYGREEYLQNEHKEIPSYCCPKRYERCNKTMAFSKGCFEAMLDKAPIDELVFFLRNFVIYFIFVELAIAVAVAEASYLRYRSY